MKWFGTKAASNTITTSQELEEAWIRHGNDSFSGITVTADVAFMVSAVGAAVSLLSEVSSMIPLPVFERLDDGGKERATNHWLWTLIHDKPNDWQNSYEFRELLTTHLLLWGNAYAFISRYRTGTKKGQISELLPIHPDRVQVEQDSEYRVTYRVALPDGSHVVLAKDQIFHIRDRSFNGFSGMSRLKSGRDSIGLARITERWGNQLFGNGARPSGTLSTDKNLTKEQMDKIRDSWTAANGGENALGTAVLDGGMKWQPTGMDMEKSQMLETRKFQILEIARIYRIPPHMIGDLERATFSNIEHQSLEFVKYSLMPWLRRWEMAINTQLLDPKDGYFVEHLVDGLLRGDIKSRYEAYSSALQNEWMTKNEVRIIENMNPVQGGDEFRNPAINPQESEATNEPAQAA